MSSDEDVLECEFDDSARGERRFERIPFPRTLRCDYSGAPFTTCSICTYPLDAIFQVQKAFHGAECVFEFAICQTCATALGSEFSEESVAKMKGFLLCHFRPVLPQPGCNFCGEPKDRFHRHSLLGIGGHEDGAHWLMGPTVIVCDDCAERLGQSLSKSTRDAHDAFIRDHFPGVPANLDLSPIGGCL